MTIPSADFAPLIVAPFVGSFLGVLVRRLPKGEPIVCSRSRCESCGTALGPFDLVPLIGFAAMRGRCRHCGAGISAFHPAIELAAFAVALCAVQFAERWELWAWCCLGWGLLALAWIDCDSMTLPNVLTLPLLGAGLAMGFLDQPDSVLPRAVGAGAGWAAFTGLAWVYRRLRHREGLGGGDAKLLAVAGAWLGLDMLPWVVLLAAAAAALWTVGTQLWRRQTIANRPVPFGPWLAAAIWILGWLSMV